DRTRDPYLVVGEPYLTGVEADQPARRLVPPVVARTGHAVVELRLLGGVEQVADAAGAVAHEDVRQQRGVEQVLLDQAQRPGHLVGREVRGAGPVRQPDPGLADRVVLHRRPGERVAAGRGRGGRGRGPGGRRRGSRRRPG